MGVIAADEVVRRLCASFVGPYPDLDASLQYFAADALYFPVAWQDPHVGRAAIRAEFERQAQLVTVLSIDIVRMASTDRVVLATALASSPLCPGVDGVAVEVLRALCTG
jgi:ketosteroid isomerase-like protein